MIEILRSEYRKKSRLLNTLIICPLSVCAGWKKQFQEYSAIDPKRIHVLTGVGRKRAELLRGLQASGQGQIVVTNFAGVRIPEFYDALLQWAPEITVIDESHNIKDAGSATAKKLYPLTTGARRRFIMTGTLTPNSLLDIYGQYKAFQPGLLGPSFFQFRTKYFYDKNAGMPKHLHFPDWKPRPEAAEQLGKLVATTSVQAKKEACIELPPLLEITVPVELGSDQKREYEKMAQEFVAECKGVQSVAEFAMTKTLRLRQILAGFVAESAGGELAWFDDVPRLTALGDLLDSTRGHKTIVWTDFVPTYKKLGHICDRMKRRAVFLTGQQRTIKDKEASLADFISGDADVLVAHAAAAGEGIDGLQVAPYAVYFMKSYSRIHLEQSMARNFRGGSTMHEKVTHYHLSATGTLDEVIHDALTKKKDVAESILSWCKTYQKVKGV